MYAWVWVGARACVSSSVCMPVRERARDEKTEVERKLESGTVSAPKHVYLFVSVSVRVHFFARIRLSVCSYVWLLLSEYASLF